MIFVLFFTFTEITIQFYARKYFCAYSGGRKLKCSLFFFLNNAKVLMASCLFLQLCNVLLCGQGDEWTADPIKPIF